MNLFIFHFYCFCRCGLVALVMAAQALNVNMQLDTVYQQALSMGITKQGEMFSATNLCQLAAQFGLKAAIVDHGLETLPPILQWLNSGQLLLVP